MRQEKLEEIANEIEKRKKYSPDNIFAKPQDKYESISILLPVEVKKPNIFSRIISFFKEKLFRK